MFSSLKSGHVCGVYCTHEEKMRAVQAYFMHGLRRQEKCVYIADEQSKTEVENFLVSCGIDLQRGKKWGQFEIYDSAESYLRNGAFDADDMTALILSLEKRSLQEGFRGSRGVGEMTWVLDDPTLEQQLISYELSLNIALSGGTFSAFCLYNSARFSEETLVSVLLAHPLVVLKGKLYNNSYYDTDFRGTYNELVEAITRHG